MNILKINSSSNTYSSTTRKYVDSVVEKLQAKNETTIIERDLVANPPSFITPEWLGAAFERNEKSAEQVAALKESDALVDELLASDVIVIGAPMYNFSVPASLKAYFDMIARAGRTFYYNEQGMPVGLVEGKKAYVTLATGGTPIGSPYDYLKGYIQTFLGFIGITDVEFVAPEAILPASEEQKVATVEAVLETI